MTSTPGHTEIDSHKDNSVEERSNALLICASTTVALAATAICGKKIPAVLRAGAALASAGAAAVTVCIIGSNSAAKHQKGLMEDPMLRW